MVFYELLRLIVLNGKHAGCIQQVKYIIARIRLRQSNNQTKRIIRSIWVVATTPCKMIALFFSLTTNRRRQSTVHFNFIIFARCGGYLCKRIEIRFHMLWKSIKLNACENQWRNKSMTNSDYSRRAKLYFKSGIFILSSKEYFFIVFFEICTLLFFLYTLQMSLTMKL